MPPVMSTPFRNVPLSLHEGNRGNGGNIRLSAWFNGSYLLPSVGAGVTGGEFGGWTFLTLIFAEKAETVQMKRARAGTQF